MKYDIFLLNFSTEIKFSVKQNVIKSLNFLFIKCLLNKIQNVTKMRFKNNIFRRDEYAQC